MTQRFGVTFSEDEINAVKDLEEQYPDLKIRSKEGDKFKEIFWAGYRALKNNSGKNVAFSTRTPDQFALSA